MSDPTRSAFSSAPKEPATSCDEPVVPAGSDVAGGEEAVMGSTGRQATITEPVDGDLVREVAAMIETLPVTILILDAMGRPLLRNKNARQSTLEESMLAPGSVTLSYLDGSLVPDPDYPFERLLRGHTIVDQEYVVNRRNGAQSTIALNGAVTGGDSRRRLVIMAYRDITAFRRAEETRADYLRAVSHDLRSPLNIIAAQVRVLVQSLEEKGLSYEPRRVEDIMRTIGRMALMIDDLAESLRFESRQVVLKRQATDLCELVKDIAMRAQMLAKGKIVVETDPCPLLQADPLKLERCIMNLLSNAIKYSPPDSPVLVRVFERNHEVRVEVHDRGPGILPEDMALIFERFYRGKNGALSAGLGLGLYIARLIAVTHGGSIRVESAPPRGSVFTLTLPLYP